MNRYAMAALVLVTGCKSDYAISEPVDVHPDEVTECAFDDVEGAPGFSAYSCNPIFTTSGEAWADTLGTTAFGSTSVLGHTFYQMWYVGSNESSEFSIGTALSPDGTNWTPYGDNPGLPDRPSTAWDGGTLQQMRVAYDEEQGVYRMLYGGITRDSTFFGVGTSISQDGLFWDTNPNNPVLSIGGSYHDLSYAWPVQYQIQGDEHRALFAAYQEDDPDSSLDLYRLTTTNPGDWLAPPARILKAGPEGSWDQQGFLDASTAALGDDTYLFYIGFRDWRVEEETGIRYTVDSYVGMAVSRNGGPWERLSQEPIPIDNGSGETLAIEARTIGDRIHLWVTDVYPDLEDNAIGYFLFEPEGA